MTRTLLILTLALVAPAFAQSTHEPFGFRYGMTKAEAIRLVGQAAVDVKNSRGDMLALSTAPKPYEAFEEYDLIISPAKGLLKIVAVGTTIQTNEFGDQIKEQFDTLSGALIQQYGPSTKRFDFLQAGSIWTEPREWTTGLFKKERTLFTYWEIADNPSNIKLVLIETKALSSESAYITVGYEFDGFEAYTTSKEADKAKVF